MNLEYKPQQGDLLEWGQNLFVVIENNGNTGIVCPLGTSFTIYQFYWNTEKTSSKFVRKATNRELEKVGLLK